MSLAERIAWQSGNLALRELHEHRPCFRLNSDGRLLLVEFVDALRETRWARGLAGPDLQLLEAARDAGVWHQVEQTPARASGK